MPDIINMTITTPPAVNMTIATQVGAAQSITGFGIKGDKGDKGDTGDAGTTNYNELTNLPDLTLKADKSDTYTKIEVDTSLAGKAELVHVHAISDVTGLQTALDGKSATGHTHTATNVTDFDTEVSNNTDVAANTAARHTHANSAVLNATTASFTTADETKLTGIAAGAQVNTVTSVNTRTGAVTGLAEASDLTAHTSNTSNPHGVTKAQVGLGNVNDTSDADKPISTATQTALDGKFTQRTITGTAAHRRGLAGQFLIAVVGMLVAQSVGGDAQGGLRDAEAPQDVVEAVGVLGRGAAGGAFGEQPGDAVVGAAGPRWRADGRRQLPRHHPAQGQAGGQPFRSV